MGALPTKWVKWIAVVLGELPLLPSNSTTLGTSPHRALLSCR